MIPALKAAALVILAVLVWCAAAYTWFMCIATLVLLPLVPAMFAISAAVTILAYLLSVAALCALFDLFSPAYADRNQS